MADFVSLTCPSCNGKLQIGKDLERFACGCCWRWVSSTGANLPKR